MKPVLILVLLCSISGSAFASGVELAIVASLPNEKMSFVRETLREKFDFTGKPGNTDYATAITYFAQKNGVQTVSAIQVLTEEGSVTTDHFHQGLELGASQAPIVLAPLGGADMQSSCLKMAAQPQTAFLLPIGSDAAFDNGALEPACYSANILFVGGMNKELTELAVNQTYGTKARIGVPYVTLTAPVGEDGRTITYTSKAFGLGMLAGKMAALLREEPSLRGGTLIQRFVDTKTAYLPSLLGKVRDARALVDVEY
ncbi:MAG: hypothetical protein AB7K68_07115 [Bacteriovoracia bacterium]